MRVPRGALPPKEAFTLAFRFAGSHFTDTFRPRGSGQRPGKRRRVMLSAPVSASQELRTRAELLHTRVTNQDPAALRRLRRCRVPAEDVQRRHCLTVIAREAGFTD